MQVGIMQFFQSISSPFLDFLGEACTFMGEQTVFIFVTAYLLWCADKQKGFAIFSSLFLSLFATNTLKAIIRQSRPFMVIEGLEGKRLETATGYSFPSGHTTGAASFYSSLAYTMRTRWLSIVCAALIFLVGLSRMYLRVHWPLDVFGGLVIGVTVTFALTRYLLALYENKSLLRLVSWIVGLASTVAAVIMAFLISAASIDEMAFEDLMKLLALASGGYIGFAIEQQAIRYCTEGKPVVKALRFAIGIAVVVAIQASKAVLPPHMLFSYLRYALTGLWATALYPWLGMHLATGKARLFECETRQ
jgi:undecaprenyl-diphosphatase